MGTAEIMNPLTVLEGRLHVSLRLAHCERAVKFIECKGDISVLWAYASSFH